MPHDCCGWIDQSLWRVECNATQHTNHAFEGMTGRGWLHTGQSWIDAGERLWQSYFGLAVVVLVAVFAVFIYVNN
jgi:hypothetical protein